MVFQVPSHVAAAVAGVIAVCVTADVALFTGVLLNVFIERDGIDGSVQAQTALERQLGAVNR